MLNKWWISTAHPVGRNISNQHDVFTAVNVKPQNLGWTEVVEKAEYDELADHIKVQNMKLDAQRQEIRKLDQDLRIQKQVNENFEYELNQAKEKLNGNN